MSPELVAAIAAGISTILGANFALIKWIIDKFLHELTPNGGKSLKDQIRTASRRYI